MHPSVLLTLRCTADPNVAACVVLQYLNLQPGRQDTADGFQ